MADDGILGSALGASQALEGMNNIVSEISSNLKSLVNILGGDTSRALETIKNKAKQVGDQTKEVAKQVTDAAKSIGMFGEMSNDTAGFIQKMKEGNEDLAVSIAKTAVAVASVTTNMFDGAASLEQYKKSASSAAEAQANFAQELVNSSKDNAFLNKLAQINQKFIETTTRAKGFENAVIESAMSGGNFYRALGGNLGSFAENMDQVMTQISTDSLASANILGISHADALKRSLDIMKQLPGEIGKVYEVSEMHGGKSVKVFRDSMTLLSQVARGTGKDFGQIMSMNEHMVATFGSTSEDAASRMAVLNKAAQTMGMPFEKLNGLINSVDSSFEMWGDQMESTVKVLGQVANALKGTGVGFAGQQKIVQDLAGAIKNSSLSLKAFLGVSAGLRTGGGAVGAGLEVEGLLQEGKMGDVVAMMQKTLETKSGAGRVLSLKEARENPNMQRDFLVQRGMLQSQMGISDVGTANRLMEAMSKASIGEGGGIDAEMALTEAMTAGKDLSQRQTDLQQTIAKNTADHTGLLQTIVNYQTGREVFGGTTEEREKYGREFNTQMQEGEGKLFQRKAMDIGGAVGTNMIRSGGATMKSLGKIATYVEGTETGQKVLNADKTGTARATLDKYKTEAATVANAMEDTSRNPRAEKSQFKTEMKAEERATATRAMNVVRNVPENSKVSFEPLKVVIEIHQDGKIIQQSVDLQTQSVIKQNERQRTGM